MAALLGGCRDVAFVIGRNFMDKLTGEKDVQWRRTRDKANTSCRVVYEQGKNRFILACRRHYPGQGDVRIRLDSSKRDVRTGD